MAGFRSRQIISTGTMIIQGWGEFKEIIMVSIGTCSSVCVPLIFNDLVHTKALYKAHSEKPHAVIVLSYRGNVIQIVMLIVLQH